MAKHDDRPQASVPADDCANLPSINEEQGGSLPNPPAYVPGHAHPHPVPGAPNDGSKPSPQALCEEAAERKEYDRKVAANERLGRVDLAARDARAQVDALNAEEDRKAVEAERKAEEDRRAKGGSA